MVPLVLTNVYTFTQDTEHLHQLKKKKKFFSALSWSISATLEASGKYWSDFYHHKVVLPILGLYIHGMYRMFFVSGFLHSAKYFDTHPYCWIYQWFAPFDCEQYSLYKFTAVVYPFSSWETSRLILVSMNKSHCTFLYKGFCGFCDICFQFSWIGITG